MNWGYLIKEDVEQFHKKYPTAYSFLLTRSLQRELISLRRPQNLSEWQEARLTELEQWEKLTFFTDLKLPGVKER